MVEHASAPSSPTPPLPLTGERTVPGIWHENYWFQRHVVAYRIAAPRGRGRVVLDAGCGEGYGLAMFAEAGARRVVGADLDPAVTAHAAEVYGATHPTIETVTCELMRLPLADDEVDLTVSFQVIEHLHDIPGYLASLDRVTRPGGELLISTPNRLTFTPGADAPVNPFHTREFTADELHDELSAAGLRVAAILGVHHGPLLRAMERVARRPIPDLLAAGPPEAWPPWLRRLVRRVTPGHFAVRTDAVDASLDLLAVCRVPRA